MSLVVAGAAAVLAIPVGVAGASKTRRRGARTARLARPSGLSLSRAPAGLRAAVQRTLGARAVSAGWSQQAKLTASDAAKNQDFGASVAIYKATAVVGTGGGPGNPGNEGAYVFLRSGTTWAQQAKLCDACGDTVAISGATAVVGGPEAAYVFVRSGTTWTQQAKLTTKSATGSTFFGESVAISGSTVVVGNPADGKPGSAYVFVRSGTAWSRQAKLTEGRGAPHDFFGFSVAISGSTAVVGAVESDAAYVFVRSGTTWSRQAKLTAPTNQFGDSVAISGSTAVVGDNGNGAVYVFARSGRKWSQQAKLTEPHAADNAFGASVAISGSTAVVGASLQGTATDYPGAAYVFVRSGTSWLRQAKLTASDGTSADFFGGSVALYGSTAVVGAPSGNSGTADTGAAYVFVHN